MDLWIIDERLDVVWLVSLGKGRFMILKKKYIKKFVQKILLRSNAIESDSLFIGFTI
jgi:hypothetical protein